jgi:hypothetical protein
MLLHQLVVVVVDHQLRQGTLLQVVQAVEVHM